MSIFLSCMHWALLVAAGLLCAGAGVIAGVGIDAWRRGNRPAAWSLAALLAVTAAVAAGMAVAAEYVR